MLVGKQKYICMNAAYARQREKGKRQFVGLMAGLDTQPRGVKQMQETKLAIKRRDLYNEKHDLVVCPPNPNPFFGRREMLCIHTRTARPAGRVLVSLTRTYCACRRLSSKTRARYSQCRPRC